jgi:multicomponent Na+:H+ antiporter subunit F
MIGVLWVLVSVLSVAMLGPVVLIVRGPTVFDRMVGVGAMGTTTLLLVGLLGWVDGRLDMFVDIAMAYAMLNFAGAIIVAKYLDVTRRRDAGWRT